MQCAIDWNHSPVACCLGLGSLAGLQRLEGLQKDAFNDELVHVHVNRAAGRSMRFGGMERAWTMNLRLSDHLSHHACSGFKVSRAPESRV